MFLKPRSTLLYFIIMVVISFLCPARVFAQTSQKRIYIGNDDHTDYMWSANEATYKQAFIEMLDYYLNQVDSTLGNASDFQGRFNADGSFWMWTYEKNKTAAQMTRLIERIKDDHITIPLNTLAMIFGGQPAEAVIRGMYYSGRVERKYGLRFPLALAMENQTLPFGLASLWAGSGAKYSWRGICNCATSLADAGNREKEIYWWGGLDGSNILLKWNSMFSGGSMSVGGYAEARYPASVVDFVDTDASFKSRYPYNVIGVFGKGWDDVKTLTNEFVTVAQQKSNSSRRVIVSNEVDFFQDFEKTYGAGLASQSVTFGNEWDLFSATVVEYSSRVKRAVEKLRSAEAMAVYVSLSSSSFMDQFVSARDQAFVDLSLFWEHCGGSGGGVGQTARQNWMSRMVSSFESYVDNLYNTSLSSLSGLIQKSGANTRFFVFNPLSWVRADVADIAYSGTIPVHVVDLTTGQDVPSQIVTINQKQNIRILASNVPAVGYKVYEIQSGEGTVFPSVITAGGGVIENNFYKITVAPRGAITSLIDKSRGNREFAKTVNNKVINDLGATTNGTLTVENSGSVSATILATSSSPVNHTSRITLYREVERVDIQNDINQSFSSNLLWGYGFNLTNPEVNHEEVGAVIRARLANDLTKPGQYSPRSVNSRYDWLTLNHFADMTGDGGVGVTLSNRDLDFMKLGASTISSLDITTPQFSPVAGGDLGSGEAYPAGQGGLTHFLQRFSLQTHDAYSQTQAMKFSMEHQNPLVTAVISGGSVYPEMSYSLLTISDPNVLLWSVKPAEEGITQGIIVRVWNQASPGKSFLIDFPNGNVIQAKETTHIETDLADINDRISRGDLATEVNRQQMKTYRLFIKQDAGPACRANVNGDSKVDAADFIQVSSNWGKVSGFGNTDINSDGKVNALDLGIVIKEWGCGN